MRPVVGYGSCCDEDGLVETGWVGPKGLGEAADRVFHTQSVSTSVI